MRLPREMKKLFQVRSKPQWSVQNDHETETAAHDRSLVALNDTSLYILTAKW